MKTNILIFVVITVMFLSCSGDNTVSVPEFESGSLLAQSLPIDDSVKAKLNGIYSVESGSDNFGGTVVGKWSGNTFSIFTGKNFAYFVLQAGRIDSTIILEGYWRYAQDENTGLTQLKLDPDEGGKELLRGETASFVFRGSFGDGASMSGNAFVIRYLRPLSQPVRPFWIIAHRGGGRNSDALPESENSLGLLQIAERFGANAVELDVRLTKDGVPIIFHDENLSPRLITGEYCIGPIANYTYAHLRVLCTLKNGEPIPTLTEALETIITKTGISLVWMDAKVPEAIPAMITLQSKFMQRASELGRSIELLIGLPDEEAVSLYLQQPSRETAPVICELDIADVQKTNAAVWAPAWTRGPMTPNVIAMHNEGRRVFFWTLDGPEYIRVFLDEGVLDGIVTNYPSIVSFEYYVR
ncbi:MAG: glycerophosphodiester phosphodiesterase [Chlorobiaceae bacterium]|nr:glycerophosphodiester phosphodiesterase [Chlorobiaceae bacterium]